MSQFKYQSRIPLIGETPALPPLNIEMEHFDDDLKPYLQTNLAPMVPGIQALRIARRIEEELAEIAMRFPPKEEDDADA